MHRITAKQGRNGLIMCPNNITKQLIPWKPEGKQKHRSTKDNLVKDCRRRELTAHKTDTAPCKGWLQTIRSWESASILRETTRRTAAQMITAHGRTLACKLLWRNGTILFNESDWSRRSKPSAPWLSTQAEYCILSISSPLSKQN